MAKSLAPRTDDFLSACCAGRATPTDAPAYIERWQSTVTDGTPLSQYLGMTDAEWRQYMEAESNLSLIIANRTMKRYPAPSATSRRRS